MYFSPMYVRLFMKLVSGVTILTLIATLTDALSLYVLPKRRAQY